MQLFDKSVQIDLCSKGIETVSCPERSHHVKYTILKFAQLAGIGLGSLLIVGQHFCSWLLSCGELSQDDLQQ